MTHVLRTYIFGTQQDEHIIKDWRELQNNSFENVIVNRVKPYIKKTQNELKAIFNVKTNSKNLNEVLLAKMLGISGKIAYTDEFQNANIIPKTIRIQKNGHIKESMSFPTFKFNEIIKETWENSTLKEYLEPAKFLFVIFKENNNGEYVFERVKFWNIPYDDLQEVKKVWEKTVKTIKDGVILTNKGGITYNNFPKAKENRVSHIRPHAKNSSDTYDLPDGRKMPKQCFWFNRKYIESIIL